MGGEEVVVVVVEQTSRSIIRFSKVNKCQHLFIG